MGGTQECSTKDSNVQSATAASLASIGIVSQSKNVQPNWPFVIGTFVIILVISFGFVTLVIVLHGKNDVQVHGNSSKRKLIYYDRVAQLEEEENNHAAKWWRKLLCCRCCRNMVDPNAESM